MLSFRAAKYAQTLRAIGQDLEAVNLKYFEIKSEGKDYLVRAATSPEPLELRYTSEDTQRLERQGRAKRRDPAGTPDFSALSQALRVIGEYIDRKDGRLLGVSKHAGAMLTLEYDTGQHRLKKEEFLASGLYDLSVRMYKRRDTR